MVNIVPIDRVRLAGKGWRRPKGYSFAATYAVAPLIGTEFAGAGTSMPIAFIEKSGQYVPVGLLSPMQERNLFVGPAGQWLGRYVPVVLRTYPFVLNRVEGSNQVTLCINEDSGLLVDSDTDTEKFFEADGTLSAPIKTTLEFLQQFEQNRAATDQAVALLAEAGIIQPWSLTVTLSNRQVPVNGLHCVDEAAMNKLSDEKFLKLRKSGSLVLAYAQLLSMSQVGVFAQLEFAQQQLAHSGQTHPTPIGEGMIRVN